MRGCGVARYIRLIDTLLCTTNVLMGTREVYRSQ
jgi:hypothetical protein